MPYEYPPAENLIKTIDWARVKAPAAHFSQETPQLITDYVDKSLFSIESGISKLVLCPLDPDNNTVMKIPFSYYEDSWYMPNQKAYLPRSEEESWDYCASELEYYYLALENNLGKFFPWTELYCYDPYPIYLQERCTPETKKFSVDADIKVWEIVDSLSLDDLTRSWFGEFLPQWTLTAIDYHGIDQVIKLFKFLDKYELDDFHETNYGYSNLDGRPLLIDFSNFNEEEY